MQVILLERIDKLGAPGSEVSVKRGYARNWLLPQGKAVLATEENRQRARKEQAQFTAKDQAKKSEAEAVQRELDGKEVILVRAAGESGQLYGSVRPQDIAEAIEQQLQIIISKKLVVLEEPVRSTGIFAVPVRLHPQVPVAVNINVAPSEDEAKRQALKRDQARQRKEQEENKKEFRKGTKSAKTAKGEKAESLEEGTQETETSQEETEDSNKASTEEKEGKASKKKSPGEKSSEKSSEQASEKQEETSEKKPVEPPSEKDEKQEKG